MAKKKKKGGVKALPFPVKHCMVVSPLNAKDGERKTLSVLGK